MRRELIEISQEHLIQCDNCNYKVENLTKDPNICIKEYINKPCPWCGSNLLTEEDYNQGVAFIKVVAWVNKWFSWFPRFGKKKKTTVHIHKGINIKTNK